MRKTERPKECIFRCSCVLTELWGGVPGCLVSASPRPVKGLCTATLTATFSSEGGISCTLNLSQDCRCHCPSLHKHTHTNTSCFVARSHTMASICLSVPTSLQWFSTLCSPAQTSSLILTLTWLQARLSFTLECRDKDVTRSQSVVTLSVERHSLSYFIPPSTNQV